MILQEERAGVWHAVFQDPHHARVGSNKYQSVELDLSSQRFTQKESILMSVIVDYSDLKRKYADNDQFKALVEHLTPYLFQNDAWDPMKEKEWNVGRQIEDGKEIGDAWYGVCRADKGKKQLWG